MPSGRQMNTTNRLLIKKWCFGLVLTAFMACNTIGKKSGSEDPYSPIQVAGTMQNVMWKGMLEGIIHLDTIKNKTGLYGLGPEQFLRGELLINDGTSYVARVTSDTTMQVDKTYDLSAPFFVYGNVARWKAMALPANVKTMKELETFVDQKTREFQRPFAFKLSGTITRGLIHLQNLPEGTQVSSPTEAHQGQVNYELQNEEVNIVGFFSTKHKGIFTHHDTFIHMHLITKDERAMGHLDEVAFDTMTLYLPEN